MVPVFSFLVAGPLIARYGAGRVIAAGCVVFAIGSARWSLSVGLAPDYVGEMLGGILLTGIGVGHPRRLPPGVARHRRDLPGRRGGRDRRAAVAAAGGGP
jgi:MFS family permease